MRSSSQMLLAKQSQSELRYRRLFEAAHDGILLIDPGTRRIIDVNPFLEKFLGYTRAEFLGKELFEIGFLRDEQASQAAFRELQSTGSIRYEDLPLETKDGRRVEVEFVSNLYQEGDQAVIQCNVRDITVRKETEKALQRATDLLGQHTAELEMMVEHRTAELRASNSQLETFVYSIAHDLRAPLRAMQGFSQLLEEEQAGNLNDTGRQYTLNISRSAQKMDKLLVDLLAFSHISQRKIELLPVGLAGVIQGALRDCESEIAAAGATIESSPSWPAVMAHAVTLQQVLVNLINNAVKFVADKKPHVRVRAERLAGGTVRIWIEDNGIGIPVKFQQRIFSAFQRLHSTAYAGTGIGLAIVQKGVERMGGRIGLISVPENGSRFWIDLPSAEIEV